MPSLLSRSARATSGGAHLLDVSGISAAAFGKKAHNNSPKKLALLHLKTLPPAFNSAIADFQRPANCKITCKNFDRPSENTAHYRGETKIFEKILKKL
ncbi:MAG: hypothetical protein ISS79_02335 [Phycisphaerae bacterium]|nr:hypothetical protein [Phycisphaerae bacterium]